VNGDRSDHHWSLLTVHWSRSSSVSAADVVNRIASRVDPLLEWPRAIRVGADRVYVDSADRAVQALTWKLGLRDRAERMLIARAVRPGMVAVDVGANVGLYTLELAHRVGPQGRVYAVEPEARTFKLLSRTLSEAGLSMVEMRQVAAADRPGWMSLYLSALDRGDHRVFPDAQERTATPVRAVTLDDVLADEKHVDFVFVDVCGAEAAVLRGMRRTLERSAKIRVLCTVSPELLRRGGAGADMLFAPLRDAGLAAHLVQAQGMTPPIDESAAWSRAVARHHIRLYFTRPWPGAQAD
jgi:FkbM family methyltransferase